LMLPGAPVLLGRGHERRERHAGGPDCRERLPGTDAAAFLPRVCFPESLEFRIKGRGRSPRRGRRAPQASRLRGGPYLYPYVITTG
jgi:hypothetical protein